MARCSLAASTSAKPIRWVNETLPPRPRARWLLMTMRLSTSSFAGIARTEVAVGTSKEVSMFLTTREAAPRNRSGFAFSSAGAGSSALAAMRLAWAAYGTRVGCAVASGAGSLTVAAALLFGVPLEAPVAGWPGVTWVSAVFPAAADSVSLGAALACVDWAADVPGASESGVPDSGAADSGVVFVLDVWFGAVGGAPSPVRSPGR